jgi:hypothetical protein
MAQRETSNPYSKNDPFASCPSAIPRSHPYYHPERNLATRQFPLLGLPGVMPRKKNNP